MTLQEYDSYTKSEGGLSRVAMASLSYSVFTNLFSFCVFVFVNCIFIFRQVFVEFTRKAIQ